MVKLWISDKLELKWNEWPEQPDFSCDFDATQSYNAAIAKAKEESILVVDQDGFTCVNNSGKPDTFVDFPIELEDGWQCNYRNQGWENCPKGLYDEYVAQGITDKIRKVARLKPVNSAHGFSEGSEFSSDSTKVFPTGTGMYFPEKQIEDLKAKLSSANDIIERLKSNESQQHDRINELEQWKEEQLFVFGPILDYCHDEANAKRLGIGLGQSISKRILEILKAYK